MAYEAKVVCDSKGPNGIRLVTFECTYPLIIHNEVMTHRMLSRNTASNRAIPVERMIEAVMEDPFIPEQWPMNQKGMQADRMIPGNTVMALPMRQEWLVARNGAVTQARQLLDLGVHKQITNRLLAPWLWTTAILTATHWANFFNLRCHPASQPEMKRLADMMQLAYYDSTPQALEDGEWHAPYAEDDMARKIVPRGPVSEPPALFTETGYSIMASVGRCAGVSYLRHGERKSGADAVDLAMRLAQAGHWSPFEHQAQAMPKDRFDWCGNFFGWKQFRKAYAGQENQLIFRPNLAATEGMKSIVNMS